MTAHGHFHWNELITRRVDEVRRFYEQVIGWSFEGMPMDEGGTYWVAKTSDGAYAAGLMDGSRLPGSPPDGWMAYIAVDDIDRRCEEASRAGATIAREPWDVPGVGRIAILKQPDGSVIGWMTPAPQP